jgi:hemerythrin superfamily protein
VINEKALAGRGGYGLLLAGAAGGLLLGRILPVIVANVKGSIGGASGRDPFANLIREHGLLLSLLDRMEATPVDQKLRRMALFLQFKRVIGKHALAEEDIVYPLLQNDAEREEASRKLYAEHASMKVNLFELERALTEEEGWKLRVQALRSEIEPHARQEEEEEFPRLRKLMDGLKNAELSRKLDQEESLLV